MTHPHYPPPAATGAGLLWGAIGLGVAGYFMWQYFAAPGEPSREQPRTEIAEYLDDYSRNLELYGVDTELDRHILCEDIHQTSFSSAEHRFGPGSGERTVRAGNYECWFDSRRMIWAGVRNPGSVGWQTVYGDR